MRKTPVIHLETRALKVVRASSSDVKAIARMINERGAELIDDGAEADNILTLVNVQLERLITGEINFCLGCGSLITMENLLENPLGMTCCQECVEKAVRNAANTIVNNLRIEIADLSDVVRMARLQNASSAVKKGDAADRSIAQAPDISESRLKSKKLRLDLLTKVMAQSFSMNCCKKDCEEEIPIPARLNSPEILFCRACQR